MLDSWSAGAPDALDSFQELVDTGGVELLGETYTTAWPAWRAGGVLRPGAGALAARCRARNSGSGRVYSATPSSIYWDGLAPAIAALGFRGVLVEGADQALGWRSPNHVYEAATAPGLRLLPRNYRFSDDVGFRFSKREWDGWPVTADKYADWIAAVPGDERPSVRGLRDVRRAPVGGDRDLRLPRATCRRRAPAGASDSCIPGELVARAPAGSASSFPSARPPGPMSSATSPPGWVTGCSILRTNGCTALRAAGCSALGDPGLVEAWRRLTTSDHVYYMCTKWFADGDVHKYFSPYASRLTRPSSPS